MPRHRVAWSLNAATISPKRAREYAEEEYAKAGKNLDEELPDFDKNFKMLKKKLGSALDIPRIEMPVIEPGDMALFNKRLNEDSVDVFKPYTKGKFVTPKGLEPEDGEWVLLGFGDGDIPDDQVRGKNTKIAVKKLLPTQSQIWFDKVIQNIIKFGVPKSGSSILNAPVIVSQDMYILDGHHRFAQAIMADPGLALKALWIPLKIDVLLEVGRSYGEAIGNRPKASLGREAAIAGRIVAKAEMAERIAKNMAAGRPDPEIMKVITDVIENIGADFVEDNVEDGSSTVRSTGLRDQGVEAVGIDYISTLEGMGAAPAGDSAVNKKMQKIIEDNYGWLSDALRRDFPEEFADVKGIITYNDAEDVGMEDEYQDYENGMWDYDNDIIIVEVGAKLLDTNKVRAYAAVTVGDAQPRYDFLAHEDFEFTDARDLEKKLTRAIRKVGGKL